MRFLRLVLNNGFFILVLATAAILSLAYSTRDQGATVKAQPLTVSAVKTTASRPPELNADSLQETPEKTQKNKSPETDTPIALKEQDTEEHDVLKKELESSIAASESAMADDKDPGIGKGLSVTDNHPPSTPVEQTLSNRQMVESILRRYNSFQEAWQAARSAFFEPNSTKAEQLYDALAIATQHPDILGEYGNLMWRLQQPEKAEQLWLASASRWIGLLRPDLAGYLADRLQAFAPKTSESIRERLRENPMESVSNQLHGAPVPLPPQNSGSGRTTH